MIIEPVLKIGGETLTKVAKKTCDKPMLEIRTLDSLGLKNKQLSGYTHHFNQFDKSLTPDFLKSLLNINEKTPLETYTKIKDEMLKAMGFKHPELLKLEYGKSKYSYSYEFLSGKMKLATSNDVSKEEMIASIRHEIEHMVQALKIYKALGKENFANALLEYRKGNGINAQSIENILERMNQDFYEIMSKDVSILNFDAKKYHKALCQYKQKDGTLEGSYNHYTNLLEKEAHAITKKILKSLGYDSTILPDLFPANYKTMIKILKDKGVHKDWHEEILSDLIFIAKVKEFVSPSDFKRFMQIYKKEKTEITQKDKNWVSKTLEKANKNDTNEKLVQKSYQQVETWLKEGKYTIEDVFDSVQQAL